METKINELKEQLKKLDCELTDKNGSRGEESEKESRKSKIYAFDLFGSKNAARFDCETNKWQQIDFGGALLNRQYFALENIGCKVFICGGGVDGKHTKNCQVINLTPSGEVETVESFSELKIERNEHYALSIRDRIYVFGGGNDCYYNDWGALSSIECSDGIGNWTEIGNLCEKRLGATGAALDGVAYVIGGNRGDGTKSVLNSVERFDPREGNKCVQVKAMKESRDWAAAAEHKGLIYVTGGANGNRDSLDTVEIYDPRRNEWIGGPRNARWPKMHDRRYFHALVADGDRLLAIGGDGDEKMEELIDGKWNTLSEKSPFDQVRAIAI